MYVTTHPSGKKTLGHWLEFFTNQTEYEYELGRISALEMLNALFGISTEVFSVLLIFL